MPPTAEPSKRQAKLEKLIDSLIERVDTLSRENLALRAQLDELPAEHARLKQNHELAREKVTAVLGRLKTLEQGLQ